MRHRNPSGDLATVLESALDVLLEKLEKERLAKADKPCGMRRPVKAGHIARAVRREVFERDAEQCTFVDAHGRRCPTRAFLEIDHIDSRALGGADDATNLRVLCRAHNLHHAEEVFGRAHVAKRIHFRKRKCGDSAAAAAIDSAADAATDPATDAAPRGLINLGFRDSEARRGVSVVRERHPENLAIEPTLREPSGWLTPTKPAGGEVLLEHDLA